MKNPNHSQQTNPDWSPDILVKKENHMVKKLSLCELVTKIMTTVLQAKKNYINVKNTFRFSACTSQKSSHPRVLGDFLLGFLKTWCFIFLSFFLLLSIILAKRVAQRICKSADKILCFILIKHQLPRLMVLVLQPLI